MELRDVLIFALRYAVNDVIDKLDNNGIAPAPPATAAFLLGACRLLAQLEPDKDTGEDASQIAPFDL